MKPSAFAYAAPETIDEALEFLARHGDEAKVLAGGQSLVPMLALRLAVFEQLIDINRTHGLSGVQRDDGTLIVGPMTRQAALLRDPLIATHAPLVAEATPLVGHFQIRNRGTIGGSIVHADPAAEFPAVALTLDASVEVASSRGPRAIPATELFESAYTTTLAPDELVLSIRIPVAADRTGFAIEEVARRHGDFALAGACAAVVVDEDRTIARARIAVFGLGDRALRLENLEQAIVGADAEVVASATEAAAAQLKPPSDVHASERYRRRIAGPLLNRVIRRAKARAAAEEH
jgi:carbon-monoxide dehydrogenase medium subunit